ncbi:MAG: ComEC/Rec2 family competence protein, partial [Holosporales bacterium]|nr:ComEC/Rec2 family competence protein [Holosporales bacterium]
MQGLHFYHDRFEQSRWFLWIPVLMAAGSVTYFSLDKEPTYTVQLLILIISIVIRKRIRKYLLSTNIIVAAGEGSGGAISEQGYSQSNSYAGGAGECGYATSEQWVSQSNLYVGERVYFVLMWLLFATNLTIAFSLGFISGKVRTALQHTPTFEAALPFSSQGNDCTTCTGIVESIEDVPRGTLKRPRQLRRCILSHLQGVPPNVKIRVQGPYKKLKNVTLFEAVSLSVEIFKPPTPLTIHGYDAQFDAYFKGLSAFGKVHEVLTGDIVSTGGTRTAGETPSHATSVSRIHIIRTQLSDKLRAHLPASVSPIATALITGDKSGITLQTRENFTRSGLSHMLAISGLHMGLLAWLVFTIFSRLLVFVPRLATRFVVKKIAAILTIPFTFGYLVLSGSSFSAIRAFIMVTLSMLAI